jgi:hypothetical protein
MVHIRLLSLGTCYVNEVKDHYRRSFRGNNDATSPWIRATTIVSEAIIDGILCANQQHQHSSFLELLRELLPNMAANTDIDQTDHFKR